MAFGKRCSLCGGKLDSNKRCVDCGLDNTKNDSNYKHLLNQSHCDEGPLTHVHRDEQEHTYTEPVSQKTSQKGQAYQYDAHAKQAYQYDSHKKQVAPKPISNGNEKKQKKASTIIGIVIALFGLLPALFGLIEEVTEDFTFGYESLEFIPEEEVEFETELLSGYYQVGVHIPEGTYCFSPTTDDYVSMTIYEFEDGELWIEDCYYFSPDDTDAVYDLELNEGEILNISTVYPLQAVAYDTLSIETHFESEAAPEPFEITGGSILTAGVDFPAGVYSISFSSVADYDEYGNVYYRIWNKDTNSAILESSIYFDSDLEYPIFLHLPLPEGSQIWLIDLESVTLSAD